MNAPVFKQSTYVDTMPVDVGYYLVVDPAHPVQLSYDGDLYEPGDPKVLNTANTTIIDSYRPKDGVVPRTGDYVVLGQEPLVEPAPGDQPPPPIMGRVVGVLHHIVPPRGDAGRQRCVSVFITRLDLTTAGMTMELGN